MAQWCWRGLAHVAWGSLLALTLVSPFAGIKWRFPQAAWLWPMKACAEDSSLLVQAGCSSRSHVVPPEKKLNGRLLSVLARPRHCTATSAIILYSFFKIPFDQFIAQQCRHY